MAQHYRAAAGYRTFNASPMKTRQKTVSSCGTESVIPIATDYYGLPSATFEAIDDLENQHRTLANLLAPFCKEEVVRIELARAGIELKLQWRAQSLDNNSGVYVRIPSNLLNDPGRAIKSGYEIQIDNRGNRPGDASSFGEADFIAHRPTGAIYPVHETAVRFPVPNGKPSKAIINTPPLANGMTITSPSRVTVFRFASTAPACSKTICRTSTKRTFIHKAMSHCKTTSMASGFSSAMFRCVRYSDGSVSPLRTFPTIQVKVALKPEKMSSRFK